MPMTATARLNTTAHPRPSTMIRGPGGSVSTLTRTPETAGGSRLILHNHRGGGKTSITPHCAGVNQEWPFWSHRVGGVVRIGDGDLRAFLVLHREAERVKRVATIVSECERVMANREYFHKTYVPRGTCFAQETLWPTSRPATAAAT